MPEAPELLAKSGSQKVSKGIIVRIDSDGTEIPVAVTKVDELNNSIVKFIKIE